MEKALIEAGKLWDAALSEGDRIAQARIKTLVMGDAHLSEAVSSSDIQKAFAIGIRQSLASKYAKLQTSWTELAVKKTVNDFKPVFEREFAFNDDVDLASNGGVPTQPGSLPNIPESTEYPSFGFTQGASAWSLAKKGARFPFTWEMVVNDEWDFISGIPNTMLEKARTTELTEVLRQLAASGGVNTTTFKTANGNTNAAGHLFDKEYKLSVDSLVLAKKEVRARKDKDGRRVAVNSFKLLVPGSAKDNAQAVLDLQTIKSIGTDREIQYSTSNSDVSLVASDELTDLGLPDTAWFLVPANGRDTKGDVLQLGFLKGRETPDLRISSDGGQYLGGGAVPGLEGSLLDDKIELRIRHSVGSNVKNPLALFASLGTEATAAPNQFPA